jgi:exodeoxyribonuclease III
MITAKKL